jgi:hypothetical protein
MKKLLFCVGVFAFLFNLQFLTADAQDAMFTYQGCVTDNGTNFTGTGQFIFILLTSTNISSQAIATANVSLGQITSIAVTDDGNGYSLEPPIVTITGGGGLGATAHVSLMLDYSVAAIAIDNPGSNYTSAPTVTIAPPPPDILRHDYWISGRLPYAVSVPVTNGLFTVVLGDTTISNMMAIDASLFTQTNLQLAIQFSDGVNGFASLEPFQNLTPTPYAIFANTAGNVDTAENLRIVRGTVNYDGSNGNGAGYTINHADTGEYIINFTPSFDQSPSITVTPANSGIDILTAQLANQASNTFEVQIHDLSAGMLQNENFSFIAIGPP